MNETSGWSLGLQVTQVIMGVTSATAHGRFCGIMKMILPICALSLSLGLVLGEAAEPKKDDATKEGKSAAAASEVAVIKTSEGDMVIEFWPDVAPKTVENFKTLAKKGFY